jgi:hypothetical protein
MSTISRPAPRPCESCPYRRDVPSGVWAAEEYDRLPAWDRDTAYQPQGLFLCHQRNGRVCAGRVGCHGGDQLLGIRLAEATGAMSGSDIEATLDYSSPVPLFSSGAEAARHGKMQIPSPGPGARRVIAKVARRRGAPDA